MVVKLFYALRTLYCIADKTLNFEAVLGLLGSHQTYVCLTFPSLNCFSQP